MSDSLSISLRGMRFHALVGILPHEREVPQPLEVDLTVWCASSGRDDAPVDYRRLYDATTAAVTREGIGYLEGLAHDVCDAVLSCDGVTRVRVRLRKPHVALGGPLDFAEITLEREA